MEVKLKFCPTCGSVLTEILDASKLPERATIWVCATCLYETMLRQMRDLRYVLGFDQPQNNAT